MLALKHLGTMVFNLSVTSLKMDRVVPDLTDVVFYWKNGVYKGVVK